MARRSGTVRPIRKGILPLDGIEGVDGLHILGRERCVDILVGHDAFLVVVVLLSVESSSSGNGGIRYSTFSPFHTGIGLFSRWACSMTFLAARWAACIPISA